MLRVMRVASVSLLLAGFASGQTADPALVARAKTLLAAAPLIDTHNDLPTMLLDKYKGDLTKADLATVQAALCADVPRLVEGGIGAQYWSVFVESSTMSTHTALHEALREFDVTLRSSSPVRPTTSSGSTRRAGSRRSSGSRAGT